VTIFVAWQFPPLPVLLFRAPGRTDHLSEVFLIYCKRGAWIFFNIQTFVVLRDLLSGGNDQPLSFFVRARKPRAASCSLQLLAVLSFAVSCFLLSRLLKDKVPTRKTRTSDEAGPSRVLSPPPRFWWYGPFLTPVTSP